MVSHYKTGYTVASFLGKKEIGVNILPLFLIRKIKNHHQVPATRGFLFVGGLVDLVNYERYDMQDKLIGFMKMRPKDVTVTSIGQ